MIRQKIVIDDGLTAYRFLPASRVPSPAAGCLHQTDRPGKAEPAGLSGKPNLFYALELAQRGFVTIAPDYPNFGDYEYDTYAHGYASCTMAGIVNHMRVVDVLAAMPEVRRGAIATIGHSLGGHNSLFLAAFDDRVRAAVTSCGFNSWAKYMGGKIAPWGGIRYMPRVVSVFNADIARMPFDFHDVLNAIAPRPIYINAPLRDSNFEYSGVDDCVAKAEQRERIVLRHPDAEHDFPPEIRMEAYEFLSKALV
ncbi:MAG: alpha/beta hydrolase [Acidobacteria bacterium]|nr:alpha/beta hydrolase [Acidobacteriota bacterium]